VIVAWPQITVAALIVFGMGVAGARFGTPKRDNYDFIDAIVGPALMTWLLYMGGFWTGCVP